MNLLNYKISNQIPKVLGLFICFFIFSFTQLMSQSEKENSADMEEEVIKIRMNFDIFKINETVRLKAQVRQKNGNRFLPMPGAVVIFYKGEAEEGNIVGRDTSNMNGVATFDLSLNPSTKDIITFSASVANNEDIVESADLLPSFMDLELLDEDSIKTVTIIVGSPGENGQFTPLADKECTLFIKRLFGFLPLTDETLITDEEGRVTFEIPNDLKGDIEGNITIVARILEDEDLGNVEVNKTIAWGLILSGNDFYTQRQLWSARANAPISLIIIVNSILFLIWGAMIYVVTKIFKIHSLGKAI